MRIVSGILAAGIAAGLSTAALADGWYVGAETGLNLAPSEKYKIDNGDQNKLKTDPGFGLLANGGYAFGQARVEGELGWRRNGTDKYAGVDGSGAVNAYTLMLNGLYDIKTGTAWTPYVGLGIGAADVSTDSVGSSVDYRHMNDDQIVFAYQGIAGVSYALNDHVDLKADYRYLRTLDSKQKIDNTNDWHGKGPYEAHSIMVGFSYKFDAPAAPIAAAAAPVVAPVVAPAPVAKQTQAVIAKSYLVFFDFDKSNITPEAQKIIEQAAANAKASKATSISLTGHTDAAGSEKYNMALSLRRANAVKAELVKQGIPENEISVVGKGKSDPLVATQDGVREPQNRRVQILLP